MHKLVCSCLFVVSGFLAGCASGRQGAVPGITTTNTPSSSSTSNLLSPVSQKYLYVVQAGRDPISTLVFPLSAASGSMPLYEIAGSQVSVDGSGNIYVLDEKNYPSYAVSSVNEYAAGSPNGKPLRSLPVGVGTKIASAEIMAVSGAGDIYLYDGNGIAVFAPDAAGDVAPTRYIQLLTKVNGVDTPAKIWANYMTVDSAGTLYVGGNSDDQPVMAFGPGANGASTPTRLIAGDKTGMGRPSCPGGYGIGGMAVNDSQEIYVLYACFPNRTTSNVPLQLYKFNALANGNVSPVALLSLTGASLAGSGLAVDSAGNIYISSRASVLEFPASSSGNATPSVVLTSPRMTAMAAPPGEDDWFDPSGTIVLH